MAEHAWVSADLVCPTCHSPLTDTVWFTWGGLLSRSRNSGPVYEIGDRLLWFSDAKGVIHPDAKVPTGQGVNVGDPRVVNVDVYEVNGVPSECPECRQKLFGSRVCIRDGVIARVDVVIAGRYDDNLLAMEIDPETGDVLRTFDIFGKASVIPWTGID